MSSHRPDRDIPRTMTASEAAALVGVSVATIRGWADAGVIPAHRTIGGHRRFEVEELREWLNRRGAPAAGRLRPPRRTGLSLPRCPHLARELNARTEAVLGAVEAGYDERVPLGVNRSTPPALRRSVLRFLRLATHALDSGSTASAIGRAELVGVRAGLQGDEGLGAVAEFTRFAVAVTAEAEALVAAGADVEDEALPVLLSVLDGVGAALVGGFTGRDLDDAGTAAPPAATRATDA